VINFGATDCPVIEANMDMETKSRLVVAILFILYGSYFTVCRKRAAQKFADAVGFDVRIYEIMLPIFGLLSLALGVFLIFAAIKTGLLTF
jgi:hypothetical protein